VSGPLSFMQRSMSLCTRAPLSASTVWAPGGFLRGGGGEDPAGAMSFTLLEYAIFGGLALAGLAKLLLTYAWRRLTGPKGRHRSAIRPRVHHGARDCVSYA